MANLRESNLPNYYKIRKQESQATLHHHKPWSALLQKPPGRAMLRRKLAVLPRVLAGHDCMR